MAAERKTHRMTVGEWRILARDSHDIKYEYVDGQVYAMSGGKPRTWSYWKRRRQDA